MARREAEKQRKRETGKVRRRVGRREGGKERNREGEKMGTPKGKH